MCLERDIDAAVERCAVEAAKDRIAQLEAERDEARADRKALTKALTGLTCSGSEFFVRRGDDYTADIEACLAWIRRSRENQHESIKSAWAERRKADQREAEAQARIATLEAERDAMRRAYAEATTLCTQANEQRQAVEAENARLRATLEYIANGDGYTFDESEGCDVIVSLDAEELSSIARAALKPQEPAQ